MKVETIITPIFEHFLNDHTNLRKRGSSIMLSTCASFWDLTIEQGFLEAQHQARPQFVSWSFNSCKIIELCSSVRSVHLLVVKSVHWFFIFIFSNLSYYEWKEVIDEIVQFHVESLSLNFFSYILDFILFFLKKDLKYIVRSIGNFLLMCNELAVSVVGFILSWFNRWWIKARLWV